MVATGEPWLMSSESRWLTTMRNTPNVGQHCCKQCWTVDGTHWWASSKTVVAYGWLYSWLTPWLTPINTLLIEKQSGWYEFSPRGSCETHVWPSAWHTKSCETHVFKDVDIPGQGWHNPAAPGTLLGDIPSQLLLRQDGNQELRHKIWPPDQGLNGLLVRHQVSIRTWWRISASNSKVRICENSTQKLCIGCICSWRFMRTCLTKRSTHIKNWMLLSWLAFKARTKFEKCRPRCLNQIWFKFDWWLVGDENA